MQVAALEMSSCLLRMLLMIKFAMLQAAGGEERERRESVRGELPRITTTDPIPPPLEPIIMVGLPAG
jgi:hypothetical protein